jgi:NADH-ubiquinone oxidoreductase chain 6
MDSLNVFYESFTNGYRVGILYVFSIVSVLCGIFVIISKNPIVSVLFLIGLFLSIAGYLIVLGMSFIGLSYLLVYVGAVSILFLFILMLINVRISELHSETSNSIPLAVIIGMCFNYPLHETLPFGFNLTNNYNNITLNSAFEYVLSNNYQ